MWFLTVLVVLAALLVVAWRRNQLGLAFLAVTVLLAGAWGVAKLALDRDYRGASGYGDCWPSCTPVQHAVDAGLAAPLVWILLGVLAAVLAALSGTRGREWKPLR
jgi:hypothetical protein